MSSVRSYAAFSATDPLRPHTIERRAPGPADVQIDILFCGVCHSDLHTVRSEWAGTIYPCVPGHEIIGTVSAVGPAVAGFRPGDLAGVGCMVDSCRTCLSCRAGLEQYCENDDITWTYNSPDKHRPGAVTLGGYSGKIVVDQAFCLRIPAGLDPAAAAPLLCAGITTYSPLKHWGTGPGRKVGVVGLGGLGHMALKIAHVMGAETVLFTTSPGKADDARRFGADTVIVSGTKTEFRRHAASFDLILDTLAVAHDLDPYLSLLRNEGALVLVGAPEHPHPAPTFGRLISRRRSIAGSLIGGIPETQEMLDFCGTHGLVSDVEIIAPGYINEAYERMLRGDVRYRFVIDTSELA
jgi:alcohol dehydrogenase (NADP+)